MIRVGTVTARVILGMGLCISPQPGSAQGKHQFPVIGEIIREDAQLDSLIPADTKIEVLASGFGWTEGPVWVREGNYLLFSDIPRNVVMKWSATDAVSIYLKPSGYTGLPQSGGVQGSNGLAIDSEGRLVFCEHGDRRISRLESHGGKRTLVDNYQGKRLNSPNDAVFRSNGDLYFTDPPYGLPQAENDHQRELDFSGVYRLSPGGALTLLTKELKFPNGIAFSPDEHYLYVSQSDPSNAIWMKYPLKPDGTIQAGKVFYDITNLAGKLPGLPDGMKVDRAGNLFAAGPGGIHIFAPNGKHLGRIDTGEPTANCAWGDDGSSLYIASNMYLCRIRTLTKGAGWN